MALDDKAQKGFLSMSENYFSRIVQGRKIAD
jgi:hypothetical protein